MPDAVTDIVTKRCGCTGQCGAAHTEGTKRTPAPCGKYPSFSTRHVAAPADPSDPVTVGATLLPWCPTCYPAALKRGQAARAEARARDTETGPLNSLF